MQNAAKYQPMIAITLAVTIGIALSFSLSFYPNAKINHGSNTGIGNSVSFVGSGLSCQSTGHPTFIFNNASCRKLPYLNGSRLPYLLVVDYDSSANFEFHSNVEGSLSIKSHVTFSIDRVKFDVIYLLDRDYDPPETDIVTEHLRINESEIDLVQGRLLQLNVSEDGSFTLFQHELVDLQIPKLTSGHHDDVETIRHINDWWRDFLRNLKTHKDRITNRSIRADQASWHFR